MMVIPAGSFVMGKPSGESAFTGYSGAEEPLRTVRLRGFAAGKFEITRGEWSAFVNDTGRPDPPGDCYTKKTGNWARDGSWRDTGFTQDDRHPVACTSWQDAQAYVVWLSQKTGKTYRLLTEAEWEYAARAGTVNMYWFGGSIGPRDANYADSGNNATVRVGSYAANAFGLYDVAGNVNEWTEDCWHHSYIGAPSDGSAWTTGTCTSRVNRGGSWVGAALDLRSALRYSNAPTDRVSSGGFRVARTVFTP